MRESGVWKMMAGMTCVALAACESPRPVNISKPIPNASPVKAAAPVGKSKVETPRKSATAERVRSIDLGNLFALMNGPKPPLIYDARFGILYRMGHIPGAISLPARSIEKQFPQERVVIEKAQAEGRKVIFYCIDPNCPDAQNAAGWMAARGVKGLLVYEGGIKEWKEAGMEVE